MPVGHVTPDTTFVLNGEPARQEAVVKDLGVKISGDLKWNSQVEYVCAKSRSRSGILLRNFRHLSKGRLMYFFNGLVRPHVPSNRHAYRTPRPKPDLKIGIDSVVVYEAVGRTAVPLETLGITTLEKRWKMLDMVQVWKILTRLELCSPIG